jgi:uncharacterized protein
MISTLVVALIRFYQRVLSPDQGLLRKFLGFQGQYCVMYPSCSEYMIQAIKKYGVLRGLYKGIRRVLRCHPYQKNLVDLP